MQRALYSIGFCFWLLAAWLVPLAALAESGPVILGVLAFRPKTEMLARWQPTADYLSQRTGRTFQVEVLNYPELEAAIQQRRLDFVLTNPSHYVLMTHRNGLSSPLATLIEIEHGQPLTQFGGVIVRRADRHDLSDLASLHDKTVATPDIGSLGGYQMQALALVKAGLAPERDLHILVTGMPHDTVIDAVLDGRADAGFVRTGVIESLVAAGRLASDQLRVIHPQAVAGFPFLHSTRLYPEWPIAAMPRTDHGLAEAVASALFALRPDDPATVQGQYHGWAIPSDYEPVRALLQTLRLPPFDTPPEFTWRDIVSRHGSAIAAIVLATALVIALLFLLARYQQRQREHEHRLAEERRQLLAALGEGVYGIDPQGLCTFVNPAALAMLGFTAEEMLGQDQHRLTHHHRPDGQPYPHAECPLHATLLDSQPRRLEEWLWRKDGSGFPVEMTVNPMPEGGAVVVFRDIGERQRLEAELRQLASTDTLTGLPNRRQFLATLGTEVARIQRFADSPAALLMLDLDHFKQVNDHHGHAAGDAVLCQFADQLRAQLRKTDLAGRLGGEEFAILLVGADGVAAQEFAERLREQIARMSTPYRDQAVTVTVSIGVSSLRPTDLSADDVLARADQALYRAKANGRNRVEAG